jgi:GNAT superfamily N-acetyltransferase
MTGNDPITPKQGPVPETGTMTVNTRPLDETIVTGIRDMARGDLERVGEILCHAFNDAAEKHGFAPRMRNAQEGTAWAWAIFRHTPHDILVADVNGRVAGICCLHPRGDQGGIGPVAVDPAYQGKGIGRQLMAALVKRADALQSVRLFQESFNPASFSLYYALDFLPVADLLEMTADPKGGKGAMLSDNVQELALPDLDEACSYDLPRSKYDRRADLAYYAKWGKVFVFRNESQIRGLLACLPGPQSVQCGPLVAEGEEEAQSLYRHALAVYRERPCQTRVMARDRALVRTLRELGFTIYCLNMLMVRGSWRPGPSIEAFGRFPEGV